MCTFKNVDRMKPMGEKVMAGRKVVEFDSNMILQRCLVLMRNPDVNADQLFEDELPVCLSSLFSKNGPLRSADDKVALINLIFKEYKAESTY